MSRFLEAPEWDDDVAEVGWRVALWLWAENRIFRPLGTNPILSEVDDVWLRA